MTSIGQDKSFISQSNQTETLSVNGSILSEQQQPHSELATVEVVESDLSTENFLKAKTSEAIAVYQVYVHCEYRLAMIAIEVKQRVGHGEFDRWLKDDLLKKVGLSYPTLHRWMRIARIFSEEFDDFQNSQIESFQDTALYHLTKKKVPFEARQEALRKASSGEVVTFEVATAIVDRYIKKESEAEPEFLKPVVISSLPKPEIISVRPSLAKVKERSANGSLEYESLKADSWHQLGRHKLFCGYPNSPQFKKKLPKNVAATFAFPPTINWSLDLPVVAKSSLAFHSEFGTDLSSLLLQDLLGTYLELTTEEDEVVIFCFMNEPKCLLLMDELRLDCYIAEPNLERCEQIIIFWNQKLNKILIN